MTDDVTALAECAAALRPSPGGAPMTDAAILAALGSVSFEPSCVVPDDPGEVVRGAQPLDETARRQLREQAIARMTYDADAVRLRERRIAIEQGHIRQIRRRA